MHRFRGDTRDCGVRVDGGRTYCTCRASSSDHQAHNELIERQHHRIVKQIRNQPFVVIRSRWREVKYE